MPQSKQLINKPSKKLYRSLVATALLANGIFQFVAPVLAEGTAAGTSISNTATATYEDPNNQGTQINATSNTVVVTIAEVAGVTVTAGGTAFKTDAKNDGKINVGDTIYYNYTVKNVGNDPTKFRIPDQPTVTGPGQIDGQVQISYNNGTNWEDVASGGTITNSIVPDGSILVRVPVKVAVGATSGQSISVQLGNTPGNAQNVSRQENGNDLYTVDNTGTENNDIAGDPANGVREASATEQVTVDVTLKSYSLASIFETRTAHTVAGNAGPQGDTVSYELSLRVEDNDPTGNGITPASLTGTTINVDGNNGTYILVSHAIPAGTKLAAAPTAPTGWQVVYNTTGDVTTTDANQAAWIMTKPADLTTVKRIGFIKTGSIAPGTTVPGFQINLEVTDSSFSVTVANIAQLFGASPNGDPVYDESGDQSPSNYDGNNFPGTDIDGDKIPDTLPNTAVDDGYIDPTDADTNGIPDELEGANGVGIDTQNNNSGAGAGGEANIFTITTPAAISVLNGPVNAPDAVAENDNNKDFTNKSSLVPADTAPNSKLDPNGVSFTNTLKNTGNTAANMSLLPTSPATLTDLPADTVVTISYQSLSATYKYNQTTGFVFMSGQGLVGGQAISASNPIRIDGVAANASKDYGVEVNLPSGTQLSTDIDRGFPVPITAFVDSDSEGDIDAAEAQNITIDRVYTGFLKMVKESRVVQNIGPAPFGSDGTFSADPKKPAPGNIIEYRIKYSNISEPQSGTGNVILNASKVMITEDGTTWDGTKGNNWALDNDQNNEIDTSNMVGIAKDSGDANIEFYSGKPASTVAIDQTGTTANTDVTKYVVKVTGNVVPGQERTFIFQRLVNGTAPTGTVTP